MKALITDVDNTLFDWVDIWYRSFTAMMNEVAKITGILPDALYPSIQKIHVKHGTSEYAFLLGEIPELTEIYGDKVAVKLEPAIVAYRQARTDALRLYPGVLDTLTKLANNNIKLIAYTESMSFYSSYRFRKLGLDRVFDFLYSPPDHSIPHEDIRLIRKYPEETYQFKKTVHNHTPMGEKKPNSKILMTILSEQGMVPSDAMYVGDSLMKDIVMAQEANVSDVFAAYGVSQHREQYELLKKVTHWLQVDVDREKDIITLKTVVPSIVLKDSLDEILPYFNLE